MPFNNLMQAPGNSVGMVPPEYQQQQMELQRKRALAQALAQSSMTPLQSRPAGRFVAAPTPLEAISKIGQAFVGAKMGQQADTAQGEMAQKIAEQRRQALAAALSQAQGSQQPPADLGGGPAMPPNPQAATSTLASSTDPMLQGMGLQMMGQQMTPYSLGPDQRRFVGGTPIAQGVERPQPMKAPPMRERREGDLVIQEQMQPDGSWKEIGRGPKFKTTPDVKVDIDNKGEGKYVERLGTITAEEDRDQYQAAQAAKENIVKIDNQIDLMKNSQAITGLGAQLFKNVERAKALFLQDAKAGKKASDTELLDALLGQEVFPMIKQLGIGARGLDTPAERDFLRNVMTGTTPLNKETLVRLAEIRRDIAARAVDRWNERINTGELDLFFKTTRKPKGPIEIPKRKRGPEQAPAGIDPAVWNEMDEADKALWRTN